jgi:hypothetical protein
MPLGALSSVEGIRGKAAKKLARQYHTTLTELCKECKEMDKAASEAVGAANALLELLGNDVGVEGGSKVGSLRPWQSVSPVFASIPAPRLYIMLREIYSMMQQESEVKDSICQLMMPLNPSQRQSDSNVVSLQVYKALEEASKDEPKKIKRDDDGLLRNCLSVALTTWMSSVYLNGDRYQELVAILVDEMSGF